MDASSDLPPTKLKSDPSLLDLIASKISTASQKTSTQAVGNSASASQRSSPTNSNERMQISSNSSLNPQKDAKFTVKYGHNSNWTLTISEPMTAIQLQNILIQHQASLKFITFSAGILQSALRWDMEGRIALPALKKLTLDISPSNNEEVFNQFKRLLHFLKEVEFLALDSVRVICDPSTASRLPLAQAFIPVLDLNQSHPLVDLIRRNKDTLLTLVVGPTLEETVIKLFSSEEEPTYPKIETFRSSPNFPLLNSLTMALRGQPFLTKLAVTLSHQEAWEDVLASLVVCRGILTELSLAFLTMEGRSVDIVDLQGIQHCSALRQLSVKFSPETTLIGWGFVPKSVTSVRLQPGYLLHSDMELLVLALPNLEELNYVWVELSDDSLDEEKDESENKNGIFQVPGSNGKVDVVQHPIFVFVRSPPEKLSYLRVECGYKVPFDWESLQAEIKDKGEFFLERMGVDFVLRRVKDKEEEGKEKKGEGEDLEGQQDPDAAEEAKEESEGRSPFSMCFSLLGL